MYSVVKNKRIKKSKRIDGIEIIGLDGFLMSSRKGFKINNQLIRDVKIMDRNLSHVVAYPKVFIKYNKLINKLTDLLTSDDDSGDSYREALDLIEKFRQEIKNKYRNFLLKKEITKMSKELTALKKEAEKRLIELNEEVNKNARGRGR